ncbi:unnamed protein product [Ambrosiozyma monospora]|uniref:Unnamed protein product n=1 Tax=Ambrosiozyma monospora TaxID=43982 RepID=A0ACB5T0J8_AMBMO|nr:unnamed protein product [Ambrosiozyma monospora]
MVEARDFIKHEVVVLPKIIYDWKTDTYNQPMVEQYDELMNISEKYDKEIQSINRTRHSRFKGRQVASQSRAQAGHLDVDEWERVTFTSAELEGSDLDGLERVAFTSNAELEGPDFYLSSDIDIVGLEVLNSDYSRNSSLIIGCENDGLVKWDIARSFC